ncbi:unnamed protein product [Trichogramma brassicae]|uniref:Uncharacterized protein n=1 Tax=Trichogramma brassicae TaxID=86971 RepID=A0A6H5IG11_9HYME|nr:unnamed protein product [Trichogramma brassicae]
MPSADTCQIHLKILNIMKIHRDISRNDPRPKSKKRLCRPSADTCQITQNTQYHENSHRDISRNDPRPKSKKRVICRPPTLANSPQISRFSSLNIDSILSASGSCGEWTVVRARCTRALVSNSCFLIGGKELFQVAFLPIRVQWLSSVTRQPNPVREIPQVIFLTIRGYQPPVNGRVTQSLLVVGATKEKRRRREPCSDCELDYALTRRVAAAYMTHHVTKYTGRIKSHLMKEPISSLWWTYPCNNAMTSSAYYLIK